MAVSFLSEKRDLAIHRETTPQSPSDISILPTRELLFKYIDDRYQAELLVTNKNKEDIVLFDIKCKARLSYRVDPTAGLLNPHAKKRITIYMISKDKLAERANDSFMIRYCKYDGEYIADEPANVRNAILEMQNNGCKFSNKKLKVYFEINDAVEKELAALRFSLAKMSRQTTAAETEDFYSRSPSPYQKLLKEPGSVGQVIRRMSHVSRLNTPLNLKDSFKEDEGNSFDLIREVQNSAPTQSRPDSPARILKSPALVDNSPGKKSSTYTSARSPIRILKNQNKGSLESSPRTKKSVSIVKDAHADFSLWNHERKESNFKQHRPTNSLSQGNEEEVAPSSAYQTICDSSLCMSKETEIYKRKLQALIKKYYENQKKLKQDEEEMKKMKTEINVMKLIGISRKVEDTTVKQSRESHRMELWQFMILSIAFLIIGSALR